MISYDIIWYDTTAYDIIWHHMISYDTIKHHMILYDAIWYHMMSYDTIWCHMISYFKNVFETQPFSKKKKQMTLQNDIKNEANNQNMLYNTRTARKFCVEPFKNHFIIFLLEHDSYHLDHEWIDKWFLDGKNDSGRKKCSVRKNILCWNQKWSQL